MYNSDLIGSLSLSFHKRSRLNRFRIGRHTLQKKFYSRLVRPTIFRVISPPAHGRGAFLCFSGRRRGGKRGFCPQMTQMGTDGENRSGDDGRAWATSPVGYHLLVPMLHKGTQLEAKLGFASAAASTRSPLSSPLEKGGLRGI